MKFAKFVFGKLTRHDSKIQIIAGEPIEFHSDKVKRIIRNLEPATKTSLTEYVNRQRMNLESMVGLS